REPGETEVGQAEPRGGRAVAGHVDNGEPRLLDEPGRDPVVGAGDDEALLLLDERAERAARRHAGSPLARAIRRSSAGCEYRTSSFHRLGRRSARSEEHTSELQSRGHLVCRLLLEKKKKKT